MQGKVCHLMSEGEIMSVGAHFTRKTWLGGVEMNESSLSHSPQKKGLEEIDQCGSEMHRKGR